MSFNMRVTLCMRLHTHAYIQHTRINPFDRLAIRIWHAKGLSESGANKTNALEC